MKLYKLLKMFIYENTFELIWLLLVLKIVLEEKSSCFSKLKMTLCILESVI